MKLGGLFSGVGGFELAWTQLGHEVAWMCEWDAKARKVLEARFPGVPIYPDVRDLDPAEVQAVDVLTGGSPCQGFSIAGSRSGLEHSESQLFADYVRIMNGLAERGLQYAVWENVPGVLSIKNDDGERTFAHVIGALVGAGEPVRLDPKRKWNVGLAANAGRAVAWRVLDSRYFGVAQRRRRVFACVAFGDSAADRAGRTLLAVTEGVRGDSPSGQQTRQGAARSVAAGVGGASGVTHTLTGNGFDASEDGTGRGTPIVVESGRGEWKESNVASSLRVGGSPSTLTIRKVRSSEWVEDETGSTLAARDYKDSGDLVVEPQAFNWQSGGDARGLDLTDEPSALSTSQTPAVLLSAHESGQGWWNEADYAGTLRSEGENRPSRPTNVVMEATGNGQTPAVLLTMRAGKPGGGKGPLLAEEQSLTLATGNGQTLFQPQAFDEMNFTTSEDSHHVLRAGTKQSTGVVVPQAFRKSKRAASDTDDETRVDDGGANTLNVFDVGDTRTTHAIVEPTLAPSLTASNDPSRSPQSSEVTQQVAAINSAGYGVRRLTPVECERLQSFPDGWTEPAVSDSARYKAMGNAVTVNVVRWILGRLP